tara:strand:- start:583 stop:813 length:231 start_codon:yes stop_codon:yes gene_type:complete
MQQIDLMRVYHACLTSDEGVVVINDLTERFASNSTFVKGDPYESAFLEGQRTVVLFLQEMLSEQRMQRMMERMTDG